MTAGTRFPPIVAHGWARGLAATPKSKTALAPIDATRASLSIAYAERADIAGDAKAEERTDSGSYNLRPRHRSLETAQKPFTHAD